MTPNVPSSHASARLELITEVDDADKDIAHEEEKVRQKFTRGHSTGSYRDSRDGVGGFSGVGTTLRCYFASYAVTLPFSLLRERVMVLDGILPTRAWDFRKRGRMSWIRAHLSSL